MFCIEREDRSQGWVKEMCFKTAFKAYLNARTKSLVTFHTYRVIDTTAGDVVSLVEGRSSMPSTHGRRAKPTP